MQRRISPTAHRGWLAAGLALLSLLLAPAARPAGVTMITHGFNSDIGPWVVPMLEAIPSRFAKLGATNAACLELRIVDVGGGNHSFVVNNLNGVDPLAANTGEILIKLDWSDFAGTLLSANYSTTYAAERLAPALWQTNLIPQLGGRALVELPLHLAGHSRGASLMCEVARLLGAQGVWVDHLTLMDPHPLNNDGNSDPYPVVDGTCAIYQNILFADDYWQNIGGFLVPLGRAVPGAYSRQLTSLPGGYSSPHSDTHLWYHGTMDLRTPITVDGATIGTTQRTNWWKPLEARGTNTGFHFSRIVGGNRLNAEPAGPGLGPVRDGYNQRWDLGGGLSANRTALPLISNAWPNPVQLDVTGTNSFPAGGGTGLRVFHQSGATTNAIITLRVLLDPDLNPFNGNETLAGEFFVPGTGSNDVDAVEFALLTDALMSPGNYAVGVVAIEGARRRYLYAPQLLGVGPSQAVPVITQVTRPGAGAVQVSVQGTLGQRLVLEATQDMAGWLPLATNVVSAAPWLYADVESLLFDRRFYRAVLAP